MSDLTELVVQLGLITAKAHAQTKLLVRVTGQRAVGVMRREAPVDLGTLRGSVRLIVDGDGYGFAVGPTVEYAGYVAYGTRRQRPNPYDLRTAEQVGPEFAAGVEAIAKDMQ